MPRSLMIYVRFTQTIDEKSITKLMNFCQQKLNEGVTHFVILFSSTGGNVHWGITAYTFLKGIPARVDTHAFGRVNSVAIPIYCSGEHRLATPNSSFLFHGVGFNVNQGTRFDLKSLTERRMSLENDTNDIARIISENCDKTLEEIKDDVYNGKILRVDEAAECSLVNEIKQELFPVGTRVFTLT